MNVNANLMRLYGLIGASVLILGASACGGMAPVTSDYDIKTESSVEEAAVDEMASNESEILDVATETQEEVVSENGVKSSLEALEENGSVEQDATVVAVADLDSADLDSVVADVALPETAHAEPAITVEPKLVALGLEQTGQDTNEVTAQMASAGFYTFKKTAPSEYVLTLEGAKLTEDVAKTLIAPQGSGKIRSVRPVQQGNDILLRIFASPETMLKVKAHGTKLVVAPYDENLEFDPSEVMAQADVSEAASESAEGKSEAAANAGGDEEDVDIDVDALTEEILGAEDSYTGRVISLDLQDTDIDNALRIIAEVSNLNIIASDDVTGKVTLRLIDVPWDQALDVILKTNGLDKVQEGNVIRIAPVEKLRAERELLRQAQQAEDELEQLKVQYVRVSYAKAADLQPLVETVLTERGTVAFDERTNQLIVKDIKKGLKNVAKLVRKLDLRTPQVLIETQIIEAQRNFTRSLGTELGFFYLRSPETGNALPYNFPNSMAVGGTAQNDNGDPIPGQGSIFPSTDPRSAISILFGSSDGTKNLDVRLTQAEQEGRVKVVSRPSVAVTNNAPAVIKSVEKIRIKLPSGGVSVATGQGASAAGGSSVATEVVEIGIVLNVTAQASPDYYVLLDINAKSSALGNPSRGVDLIPPEIERSANSTVLVSSGQTFSMGGIYRISENDAVRGVPWLKDVPFLGHLFRGTDVIDTDEELIFFITPRIIEGSFDDAAMKGFVN
ncbi:MAG: type IV pilus secretin PilQ [Bdellovibrionales bacterium]|nr:type IV pilus secretin PilQ [Bdellovibrionales bacterium]